MARWQRAARLLDLPTGARVMDLGCAFGFGTKYLSPRYRAHGHDLDASYIVRARRTYPGIRFTTGEAHQIPYPNGYFDGVTLLDVLEHVLDESAVVQEIARVLRPGGKLVVSVPNEGWMAGWDSLNVFARLAPRGTRAPTDDPSWSRSPEHRHYSLSRLTAIFGAEFSVRSVTVTGVGLAEPVNLLLLLLFRALFPLPRVYRVLQYLYFGIYLAEDMVPMGTGGYHLMVVFDRT